MASVYRECVVVSIILSKVVQKISDCGIIRQLGLKFGGNIRKSCVLCVYFLIWI